MPRTRFVAALVAALLLLITACAPTRPVPGPTPGGGLALRMERPAVRAVLATATVGDVLVRVDSLVLDAAWSLLPDPTGLGPPDSLRITALGGWSGTQTGTTRFRSLPGTAGSVTMRLPFDLTQAPGSGTLVDGRVCVQPWRRGVPSPEVCRDSNPISVAFPPHPGVTGLTVTATVRAFP